MIEHGNVRIHAIPIAFSVVGFKFFVPLLATMAPAIPLDNTCVVLTGKPKEVLTPIVLAAISSALAPCA